MRPTYRFLVAGLLAFTVRTAVAGTMESAGSASNCAADNAGDHATALAFAEIYKRPVGAYGLELSTKVLALNGKRVRIIGYMVAEEAPVPGRFLLASHPAALSDVEDGPADDLPPAVIYVTLQGPDVAARVLHQQDPLEVVGALAVGNKVEADLRVSLLRVALDPPQTAARYESCTHVESEAIFRFSCLSSP